MTQKPNPQFYCGLKTISREYSERAGVNFDSFRNKLRIISAMPGFPAKAEGLGFPRREVDRFFMDNPSLLKDGRGSRQDKNDAAMETPNEVVRSPFENDLLILVKARYRTKDGVDAELLAQKIGGMISGLPDSRKFFLDFSARYRMVVESEKAEALESGRGILDPRMEFSGLSIAAMEQVVDAVNRALRVHGKNGRIQPEAQV